MRHKKWIIIVLFLFVFGTAFFLFHRSKNETDVARGVQLSPEEKAAVAAALRLHPLASEKERLIEQKRRISTWEEYINGRTEIALGVVVETGALGSSNHPWKNINTPEALTLMRAEIRTQLLNATAELRSEQPPPEDLRRLPIFDAANYPSKPSPPKYYEGPQTPEALIAEFDQYLLEMSPEASKLDEYYPKAAWLQKILDNGAVIEIDSDYGYYLSEVRRKLIELKDKPDEWRSGVLGIPPTTNFEEYEEGYIQRKIWENNITNEVAKENPGSVTTVFFPRNHPDKYLPQIGRITYVQRTPNSSAMFTMGTPLTKEQRDNLLYKGVEPEDIEIVYIDGEYNVLAKKPEPYNHQEWLEKNSYTIVPEGLRSSDGTIISPERYQKRHGVEMPYEFRQKYDEYVGTESPINSNAARREAAREAAAREVAKVEFERFHDSMRQRKEFETMADKEVSRELAKQFSKQFLSKHSLKQGNSKQLENALELMFQHGFEEGFRRVRQDSPSIADQLERYLAETQRPTEPQKKPQRPTLPKPSDTPPSQPDAP